MKFILELLLRGIGFFALFCWGMSKQKEKSIEAENKVLKKQRDNDVTSVSDADGVWDRWDNMS
jgi:hypothetical protein